MRMSSSEPKRTGREERSTAPECTLLIMAEVIGAEKESRHTETKSESDVRKSGQGRGRPGSGREHVEVRKWKEAGQMGDWGRTVTWKTMSRTQ